MRSIKVLLLSVGGLVTLFSASARADFQVTFTGVNGVSDGVDYVSPYYGTLDDNPITLYCNDFATPVYFGETWKANLTPLTSSDLSNTRYGDSAGTQLYLYQEAAWLTTQFDTHPSDLVDLQHTIWNLFVSAAPDPSSDVWLKLAQENYKSLNYADFAILTNVGVHEGAAAQQVQEYVVKVPEPDGMLLLLVMMGGCLLTIRLFRVAN